MGKRNDEMWLQRLETCRIYAVEHEGRCPPQKAVVDGFPLGIWFNTQNGLFQKGSMPEERQPMWAEFLADVGWTRYGSLRDDARWQEQFEVFRRYVEEYYRLPVISTVYEGVPVGAWLHNQYTIWQDGRLLEERRMILDEFFPAWRTPILERRAAGKELVQRFDWRHKVPEGDVCLDAVLQGEDLLTCLNKGIYGCRQYLEIFYQLSNGHSSAFSEANMRTLVVKRFGEGVFSLENRKAVFETLFPRTSFLGFNLLCAVEGFGKNRTYLLEAEEYDRNSRFAAAADMEDVVRDLLDELPENARQVLYGRVEDGLTFEQIAKDMGVSRARVHQIESKWIGRLHQISQWRELEPARDVDCLIGEAWAKAGRGLETSLGARDQGPGTRDGMCK